MINDWNKKQVDRAESTWGHTLHPYSLDMFNFLLERSNTFLDLGCGFGRFLEYLLAHKEDPEYIGYDSSLPMTERIRSRFPQYSNRIFLKDITSPIAHAQDCILCSAVLIHITLSDQRKVLQNIKATSPRAIAFDINSPSETWLRKGDHFERIIPPGFRMTWQSHYEFTKLVLNLFPNYSLTTKFYKLHSNRHKVIYLLDKGENQV